MLFTTLSFEQKLQKAEGWKWWDKIKFAYKEKQVLVEFLSLKVKKCLIFRGILFGIIKKYSFKNYITIQVICKCYWF